jgi:hypothetical protein
MTTIAWWSVCDNKQQQCKCKNYNPNDEVNDSLGWGEKIFVAYLVNIVRTSLTNGKKNYSLSSHEQKYYVSWQPIQTTIKKLEEGVEWLFN